jgi:hypothetical protein
LTWRISGLPRFPGPTEITSKRQGVSGPILNFDKKASAILRMRICFEAVTASSGGPNPVPARVLTSMKTIVSPSRAMMSISPWRARNPRARTRQRPFSR